MTLKELMIERILFAMTEEELSAKCHITVDELSELSDIDFLEIFDYATVITSE